jgi:hypothetical protein
MVFLAMSPCKEVHLPGGGVAFVRYANRRAPKCRWCENQSTKLCDFVISPPEQITHKKTCDAPMCDVHAKSVGANLDYCPEHAK